MNKIQFSSPWCKTTAAAATTNLMWMNLRYTLCTYMTAALIFRCSTIATQIASVILNQLNLTYVCVQIVQIQIATAYLLFSFGNFYCNLFELDNLRVPGTIWQNNFLLIFWSKRVCRELHSNKMEEFKLYLQFYFRSCKELNSMKTLYWKRGTVYKENWLCFLIRNFNHSYG